jgi:rare lipoprotein A
VQVEPLSAPEAAPPPVQRQAQTNPSASKSKPSHIAPTPAPPGGVSADDLDYIQTHKPILTEEGMATWYTAAKNRQSANGQLSATTL